MKAENVKPFEKHQRAFTLIEIMVVVGIIVLLVALLVPAVSAARGSARKAATSTQLRNISSACESYYQIFRAYPGALLETDYDGTSYSSSQALVAALTRAFFVADPGATPPGPGTDIGTFRGTAFWTANNPAVLPRDYSENNGPGAVGYRNYDAQINPAAADLSSGVGIVLNGGLNTPTFVDSAFGTDALPILYYRASKKYNPEIVPLPKIVSDAQGTNGVFYSLANTYVGTGGGGSQTYQTAKASITRLNESILDAKNMLSQSVAGNNIPRGGFVLISAGADRYFGPDPKGNVDDIIVSGGN